MASNIVYSGVPLIALKAAGPTSTISSSESDITTYSVVSADPYNAFNASTGVFTCPQSGYYQVEANMQIGATFTTNDDNYVALAVNSVVVMYGSARGVTGVIYVKPSLDTLVYCAAGDTIKLRVVSQGSSPAFVDATVDFVSIFLVNN